MKPLEMLSLALDVITIILTLQHDAARVQIASRNGFR